MTTLDNPNPEQNKTTRTLTLIPQNYKNELFEHNLAFFKRQHPSNYNAVVNYTCQEYRLCSNPDGSPNILDMKSKHPLYLSYTMDDILETIRKKISNLSCYARIGENFVLGGGKNWREKNPIQVNMADKLYKDGIFHDLKVTHDNLIPIQGYRSNYLPLLRVYGIGLGYHLTELIKKRKISYMTIYEPHVDLFYTSLFTIPWHLIFKYFDGSGKGLNLVLGGTPDAAISNNVAFIRQRLMPLTSLFYRYKHFNTEKINEIIAKEPQSDSVESNQNDAGWYEDQRSGFFHSAKNIQKGHKYFSGKKVKHFFRAFIIGSGPSLNETINYIKAHQNDALIVSCGSAITPLLKAGIIPDYEVLQERVWYTQLFEKIHDPDVLKKISLLKLNVVSPEMDKYYKETLVFQKFRDPGSSLLENNYAITTAVNPTVTNAGIAMCADLGVNEVYLFGVDYGAPKESKKMHASNTIYDRESIDDRVESKTNFDLPGNFGSPIRTSLVLSWSHQTTEMKIAEFTGIKWFNVGEGALISGTIPVKTENLPTKFSPKIQKKRLQKEISSCFNNHYSPTERIERLKTKKMQEVEEYFQAIIGFSNSTPQTREEIINVLSLMYNAINIGQDLSHFLPSPLLSFGFKKFVTNVYIQSSIAKDDDSAARFFENAKSVLVEYIDDIEKDLTKILKTI